MASYASHALVFHMSRLTIFVYVFFLLICFCNFEFIALIELCNGMKFFVYTFKINQNKAGCCFDVSMCLTKNNKKKMQQNFMYIVNVLTL